MDKLEEALNGENAEKVASTLKWVEVKSDWLAKNTSWFPPVALAALQVHSISSVGGKMFVKTQDGVTRIDNFFDTNEAKLSEWDKKISAQVRFNILGLGEGEAVVLDEERTMAIKVARELGLALGSKSSGTKGFMTTAGPNPYGGTDPHGLFGYKSGAKAGLVFYCPGGTPEEKSAAPELPMYRPAHEAAAAAASDLSNIKVSELHPQWRRESRPNPTYCSLSSSCA